jgi:hypothetical protein
MKIIFLLLFFSFTFNHGLQSLKTKIKVVNFKTREINRDTYKLVWTLALIIIIKKKLDKHPTSLIYQTKDSVVNFLRP